MFFVQIFEEALFDVDEVLDIFSPDGESIEEQIEAIVFALLLSQQLDYSPQNQVLLLLVVFGPDVSNFLHQLGCPPSAQIVISGFDRENAHPKQAAIKLEVG